MNNIMIWIQLRGHLFLSLVVLVLGFGCGGSDVLLMDDRTKEEVRSIRWMLGDEREPLSRVGFLVRESKSGISYGGDTAGWTGAMEKFQSVVKTIPVSMTMTVVDSAFKDRTSKCTMKRIEANTDVSIQYDATLYVWLHHVVERGLFSGYDGHLHIHASLMYKGKEVYMRNDLNSRSVSLEGYSEIYNYRTIYFDYLRKALGIIANDLLCRQVN